MSKVQCSACECLFKSRFGSLDDEDEPTCPTCRAGDHRRDPPEIECGVCGDEPIEERELRSLSGQTLEDVHACVLQNGEVALHREDDSDG